MFEQVIELASSNWRDGNCECELALRSSEGASPSHELVAEGAEPSEQEDRRASRRGAASLRLGAQFGAPGRGCGRASWTGRRSGWR